MDIEAMIQKSAARSLRQQWRYGDTLVFAQYTNGNMKIGKQSAGRTEDVSGLVAAALDLPMMDDGSGQIINPNLYDLVCELVSKTKIKLPDECSLVWVEPDQIFTYKGGKKIILKGAK